MEHLENNIMVNIIIICTKKTVNLAVLQKLNQLYKEKVEITLKISKINFFLSFKVKTTVYLKCISKLKNSLSFKAVSTDSYESKINLHS